MIVRRVKVPQVVALSLLAAACGEGESGNVMASGPESLSPEQVNAALGPELANVGNAADSEGAVEASDDGESVEAELGIETGPDETPADNTVEDR